MDNKGDNDLANDDTDTEDESSNNEDLVLTKIEAWVVANNARLHAQMIKANRGRSALFLDIRFRISVIYFILSYKDRFICILLNYQSTTRS